MTRHKVLCFFSLLLVPPGSDCSAPPLPCLPSRRRCPRGQGRRGRLPRPPTTWRSRRGREYCWEASRGTVKLEKKVNRSRFFTRAKAYCTYNKKKFHCCQRKILKFLYLLCFSGSVGSHRSKLHSWKWESKYWENTINTDGGRVSSSCVECHLGRKSEL